MAPHPIPTPPLRPLLSVSEAAVVLGISRSVAYEWLARHELPGAVLVGKRWYVRRHVLEAWLYGQLDDDRYRGLAA